MNKPIPEDLAGYQHITGGMIEHGDILVFGPGRLKSWANATIGSPVIRDRVFDVYRKMACPKQGDHGKGYDSGGFFTGGIPRNIVDDNTKAKTNDEGKPPLAHLPWDAIEEVSKVQMYGHQKYHDYHNYRKGMEVGRNVSCSMRHLSAYMKGNDLDHESKVSHLAHAACRALYALQNLIDGVAIDDRYKPQK